MAVITPLVAALGDEPDRDAVLVRLVDGIVRVDVGVGVKCIQVSDAGTWAYVFEYK